MANQPSAIAEVATQPRRSIVADMAARYGMDPQAFEATMRATVMPPNATREEFAAFCVVAKKYGLNPITREIFAMQKQGGGLLPIVCVRWLGEHSEQPPAVRRHGIHRPCQLTGDGRGDHLSHSSARTARIRSRRQSISSNASAKPRHGTNGRAGCCGTRR